jgi:hypothetical protein
MASTQVTGTFDTLPGRRVALTVTITDGTSHTSPVVNAVATDYVDVSGVRNVSIQVVNGASNTCTFTLQGSNDGTNWNTIAYGQGSSAAYTQGALAASAGTSYILYLPPDDTIKYVRANVSGANSNGTTFTVHGRN